MSRIHDDLHPGTLFIDRYMPGASETERMQALDNLERFVAVLVRINARLERDAHSVDSHECGSLDRVEEAGKPPSV